MTISLIDQEAPAWLWVEWYLGGIRAILDTWQDGLMLRYDMSGVSDYMLYAVEPDIEREALDNIDREARALRRYEQGRYRGALKAYERQMLDLEIEVMRKYPHIRGLAKYEWIAERMNHAGDNWTPRMVRQVMDETSRVIRELYDLELRAKFVQSALLLAKVWREAVAETVVDAAA